MEKLTYIYIYMNKFTEATIKYLQLKDSKFRHQNTPRESFQVSLSSKILLKLSSCGIGGLADHCAKKEIHFRTQKKKKNVTKKEQKKEVSKGFVLDCQHS